MGVPYQLAFVAEKLIRRYQLPKRPEEQAKFRCVQEFLPVEVKIPGDLSTVFAEGVETKKFSVKDYRVQVHLPEIARNPVFERYQFLNNFSDRWYPFFDKNSKYHLREYLKNENHERCYGCQLDKTAQTLGEVLILLTAQGISFEGFLPFLQKHPLRYVEMLTTKGNPAQGYVTTGVRVSEGFGMFQFSIRVVNSHVTRESTDLWFRFEKDPLTRKETAGVKVVYNSAKFVFSRGMYPDEVISLMSVYTQDRVLTPTTNGFVVTKKFQYGTLTTTFVVDPPVRNVKTFTPLSLGEYQRLFGSILKGLDEESFARVEEAGMEPYRRVLDLINRFLENLEPQVLFADEELVDFSSSDPLIKMLENLKLTPNLDYLPLVTCAQYGFLPLFKYISEREGYTFSLKGEEEEIDEWVDWEVCVPCVRVALQYCQPEIIEYLYQAAGSRLNNLIQEESLEDVEMMLPRQLMPTLLRMMREYDNEIDTPISINNLVRGLTPELVLEYEETLAVIFYEFIDNLGMLEDSELLPSSESTQFARLIPDKYVSEYLEKFDENEPEDLVEMEGIFAMLRGTHPHLFKK